MKTLQIFCFSLLLLAVPSSALAQDSDSDLAAKTQNPIADLISLPLQNNFNFGFGPDDDLQYTLNVQPVIPTKITERFNLINRVIAPVVYLPEVVPGTGSEFGLGDIVYQGFFAPSNDESPVMWGVGPVLSFPSATEDVLGSEKWSAGPTAVLVAQPKPWVIGFTTYNIWSFEGDSDRDDVNFFLFQYFVNYNLPSGWYITSAPINTANWEADSSDRWTVPLGAGAGKVIRFGKLPVNTSLQGYYNVEHPEDAADWQLRFQVQFLFPKG